jgi:phosphoadenosine phosphosulfate reductase
MTVIRKDLQRKINYSISLIKKSEKTALMLNEQDGFYVAFSGGKDSQAILQLIKEAKVKYKVYMSVTTIDPPELIKFIKHNYPEVSFNKPKMSIYAMAMKKRGLPTRKMRWCCSEFKETGGLGNVVVTGIRHEESSRRATRKELEISHRKFSGNFDEFSEHKESMVSCVRGKDKVILSPIIEWTSKDVWEYLNDRKLKHCELYDEGYTRIGCICCPMSSLKCKIRDLKRYPHIEHKWKQVIQYLIDNGYTKNEKETADFMFSWWISGKSYRQYYAEEIEQQKIKF